MAGTISTTNSTSKTRSESHSTSKNKSSSQSTSTTKSVLDEALRDRILAGLQGYMTDEEMQAYAKNLLSPVRNAQLEAAQQQYETTKLGKEQEIENLAQTLARSIREQEAAYGQNAAKLQTAALARGMGRSSYTLDMLKNQGNSLAEAVRALTQENARAQNQIRRQITQAAQQNAQTQGRVNTDYAASLAAKTQELRAQQRSSYNQDYLTAVSASMGKLAQENQSTLGSSTTDTKGSSRTDAKSTTITMPL